MSDTKLPTLAISNPLCAICLEETDSEADGWSCYDCGVQWNADGSEPERTYGDGQCRSTYTREHGGLSLETETFRCMRYDDHDAAGHVNSNLLCSWKNGDPGVSEVAE